MQSIVNNVQDRTLKDAIQTTCCVVGGGPAGVVLAYLLARQGVSVYLLEAHTDFEREFRGDTLHPSTLRILDELGLMDRLLQIPHTKMERMSFQTSDGLLTFANFAQLQRRYGYIALIPQAQFLTFMTQEASQYPDFHLVMGAQVDELIEEADKVVGVRYHGQDGWHEIRSILTIGADGRFSRLRKLAGFDAVKTSPPMDILWFRLSHKADDPDVAFGRFERRHIVAVIDRGDYWQLGYVVPKGSYQKVRAAGMEQLRQDIAGAVPELADRVQELQAWKQVSVLAVESNRLPRWYRPGLLLLGDAAHVMSPVGGVGINYAIQDAVVSANILSRRLRYGIVSVQDLARIERQRRFPTLFIQTFQTLIQRLIFQNAVDTSRAFSLPSVLRLIASVPLLRRIPAYIIGFGIVPVHVKLQ